MNLKDHLFRAIELASSQTSIVWICTLCTVALTRKALARDALFLYWGYCRDCCSALWTRPGVLGFSVYQPAHWIFMLKLHKKPHKNLLWKGTICYRVLEKSITFSTIIWVVVYNFSVPWVWMLAPCNSRSTLKSETHFPRRTLPRLKFIGHFQSPSTLCY